MNKIKINISANKTTLVDISFNFENKLAIIGQSGSGKSLSLKALMNLLPKNLSSKIDLDKINYKDFALVPQNPFTSLSPMTKIKNQFFCSEDKAIEMLKLVSLEKWVLNRYPNELSGGQLQRVIIAISLSTNSKILLLDEPTTALDKKNKDLVKKLLNYLHKTLKVKLIFVSHDIESIKDLCEQIIIIKDGHIIEEGNTIEVLNKPSNSYTKSLIDSSFENRKFRE